MCLTIARGADHHAAWQGQPPADFATDLARLQADYAAVVAKAAAEAALENAAFVLARALALHFKEGRHLDHYGRVDFTRTDLVVQFDGSEAGRRIGEAWRRARIIVDSGRSSGTTAPTLPTSPASPQ
ncbi:MAG TPA: hypothetical protein PKE47_04535 [Verrucomicrobiota bacterium]|nr:hypothetical protein [Verrucomicrobiota bacterium]